MHLCKKERKKKKNLQIRTAVGKKNDSQFGHIKELIPALQSMNLILIISCK